MKKILNHAGLLAGATLLALATSSCADEELVGVQKILVIEPYEEVEGTYASTSTDPDLRIDLGEVPVYGVKKALFKVTNPSTVTIRINSIDYDTRLTQTFDKPLANLLLPHLKPKMDDSEIDPFISKSKSLLYRPILAGNRM